MELPYVHAELFKSMSSGLLRNLAVRPAGCGKTLIAKAVANSLAKKVAEKTGVREAKVSF